MLEQEFGVSRIGLFGSYATGKAVPDSDVDILVSFRQNLPHLYERKSALRSYLELSLNRPVDLCSEKHLKPYFRDCILKQAIYV